MAGRIDGNVRVVTGAAASAAPSPGASRPGLRAEHSSPAASPPWTGKRWPDVQVYVARRLLLFIPTLFGASLMIFVLASPR